MIALINNFKTYYLKNNLLQLALVECAFTYSIDVIEVERVVGLDVILVIWKQVIVDLQMSKGTSPLISYSLFISFPHRLNFLVILSRLVLRCLKL